VDCRKASRRNFRIWLKTVVMRSNLAELADIARLASDLGVEVFYQPIEQNYGQKYDPYWYQQSNLWVEGADAAARSIDDLVRLKQNGLPIANSESNLQVIPQYFRHPDLWMRKVRDHVAEGDSSFCMSGVEYFEILPNGDVKICGGGETIGNCRETHPRKIWRTRPACWREKCNVAR
jgi:MoaA/NifB/PqqE/SkfB family radical SAM enzyme